MNIKRGYRFVLGSGLLLAVTTALALGYSQRLLFEDTTRAGRLAHIATQTSQLVQLTHEILLYDGARAVDQWERLFAELGPLIAAERPQAAPDESRILDALSNRLRELPDLQRRTMQARSAAADPAVRDILTQQLFHQGATQLQESSRALRVMAQDDLRAAYDRSKRQQFMIFGVAFGLGLFYGIVVSALFRRAVLKPLAGLEDTIRAIREGRPARATVRADDEIGTVCQTFNALLDEQELTQRKLGAMADRFRDVFEQAAVGMSLMTPEGTWIEANRRLCDILGYRRDELARLNYRDVAAPESRDDDERHLSLMLSGARRDAAWEKQCVRKDGVTVWTMVTMAVSRNDDGTPRYLVAVTEDISLRKETERRIGAFNRQLAEQADDLRRINAELESFAYLASHDLREPLRTITSYIDLIRRRLGDNIDGDVREFMDFATDGARKMNARILGLLAYSQIGKQAATGGDVSLSAAVRECLALLTAAIEKSTARIVIPNNDAVVMGVPDDIVRLFQNLIDNAIKFRGPDVAPVVQIDWTRDGDAWTVGVRDNGIGIPPPYREQVFGIFKRLSHGDQYEGTGIGLAIAKKIVEQHDGQIWIDPDVTDGCRVVFRLPAA